MIYLELFLVFLKIGAVTFGGGYAMLAVIQGEVVGRGWCSAGEFADLAAMAQMTPGPIAINTATYVGMRIGGIGGAFLATLAFITPSLIIATAVSLLLHHIRKNRFVEGALSGIRSASLGLILAAVVFFSENSFLSGNLKEGFNVVPAPLAVFALIFTACSLFKLKPVMAILLSLFLGVGFSFLFPAV